MSLPSKFEPRADRSKRTMRIWSDPAAEAYSKRTGLFSWRSSGAALFSFAAMMSASLFIAARLDGWLLSGVLVAAVALSVLAVATLLVNEPRQTILKLEEAGKVSRVAFHARRYFSRQAWGDESDSFFSKLDDGKTLFLRGQYLHGFAETTGDAEPARPRSFPHAEFEISRHALRAQVLDIAGRGELPAPDFRAPASKPASRDGRCDGELLDEPYDVLLSAARRVS